MEASDNFSDLIGFIDDSEANDEILDILEADMPYDPMGESSSEDSPSEDNSFDSESIM